MRRICLPNKSETKQNFKSRVTMCTNSSKFASRRPVSPCFQNTTANMLQKNRPNTLLRRGGLWKSLPQPSHHRFRLVCFLSLSGKIHIDRLQPLLLVLAQITLAKILWPHENFAKCPQTHAPS
jgi:hypothetical protein